MTRARDVATQGGLVLLTPGSATGGTIGATGGITFSSVASVTISNIFSSAYKNYRIVCTDMAWSANSNHMSMQMDASGTSRTTGYYQAGIGNWYNAASTQYYNVSNGSAFQYLIYTASTVVGSSCIIDVINPYETSITLIQSNSISDQIYANYIGGQVGGGSYNGFKLFPTAGTFSGTIKVYGYK